MRKLALLAAASIAAVGISTPAQAQLTQIMGPGPNGEFTGNDCTGGFSACYASQAGVNVPGDLSSLVVIKFNAEFGVSEISSNYGTIDGSEFSFTFNGNNNTLGFTYSPDADDPILHYFDIKQGNEFVLWYDGSADGLGTVSPINLSTYFVGSGISHITFFDSNAAAVPEPATWAMMLMGFGATGIAMRRRRRKLAFAQFA